MIWTGSILTRAHCGHGRRSHSRSEDWTEPLKLTSLADRDTFLSTPDPSGDLWGSESAQSCWRRYFPGWQKPCDRFPSPTKIVRERGLNYKDFLHISLLLVLTPVTVRCHLEVLEDIHIRVLPKTCIGSRGTRHTCCLWTLRLGSRCSAPAGCQIVTA